MRVYLSKPKRLALILISLFMTIGAGVGSKTYHSSAFASTSTTKPQVVTQTTAKTPMQKIQMRRLKACERMIDADIFTNNFKYFTSKNLAYHTAMTSLYSCMKIKEMIGD